MTKTKAQVKAEIVTGYPLTDAFIDDIIDLIPGDAGVLDDAAIPATIARDTEVSGAVSTHNGLATAHGLTANISAALAAAASPSAGNAFAVKGTDTLNGKKTFDYGVVPSTSQTVFEFKPLDGSPTTPSNYLAFTSTLFDVGKPECQSMYFGFNLGGGGARVMAGHPAMGFVVEGNWWTGGVEYIEAHCFYLTKNNVQYRPFSITVNAETDFISFAHYVDDYAISSKSGYSVFALTAGADAAHSTLALHGTLHMTSSFQLDSGGGVAKANNNVVWLTQVNAAQNANLNIAYIDDSNTLVLGGTGVSKVFTAQTFQCNGNLDHYGSKVGFFGVGAVSKPTGVAVSAAGIHAELVTLGLIAA
jgi:hypothetical protein